VRGNIDFVLQRGVPFGDGKLLDVYRPGDDGRPPGPTVLLWHGVGRDERDVVQPLAVMVAASHGLTVVASDWQSDAPDGGHAHLRASLDYVRAAAPSLGGLGADSIVLAGWSRGGRNAAAVAVRPDAVGGWRPMAVVCLGAAYTRDAPVTFSSPIADLAACDAPPVPFWLVHGTLDTVVPVAASQEWAALLRDRGWPVRLETPQTDHAGVIGAEYRTVAGHGVAGRAVPAMGGHAVAAGELSAAMIAEAAHWARG
jgi:predicted esterase